MWWGRRPWAEPRDLAPSPWSSTYTPVRHPHPCRVLQLFLSRSAQRGPHLSNGRLLQRLGLLLLPVLGFLVVWTVGALERGIHTPLVTRGHTPTGRHFYLCHHDHWDYIMVVGELLPLSPPRSGPPLCASRRPPDLPGPPALPPVPWPRLPTPSTASTERGPVAAEPEPDSRPPCPTAEMLLLCWGGFLCYATRAVPSAFHEPRYLGIALHNELLLSAAFHVAR